MEAAKPEGVQKKKRPGRQARERKKAGLAVRPTKGKDGAVPDAGAAASWPATLEEQSASCVDCWKQFRWPVDEQEQFRANGFAYKPPTRCTACRRAKKAKYDSGGAEAHAARCFNCGKNGHLSRDCTAPRVQAACYTCGSTEHLSKACPVSTTRCFHCGQDGHFSTECTEKPVEAPCRYCGTVGHPSKACPTSVAWKATQPCRLFQRAGECSRTNCLFAHIAKG
jgi:cellular nucleic acid-binding protein